VKASDVLIKRDGERIVGIHSLTNQALRMKSADDLAEHARILLSIVDEMPRTTLKIEASLEFLRVARFAVEERAMPITHVIPRIRW
jgi:hypothetical protein